MNHPIPVSPDRSTTKPDPARAQRVAIVYHSIAHYRAGVMEELHFHGRHDYTFMADDHDFETPIETWKPPSGIAFRRCRCHRLWGSVMWQSGVIWPALTGHFDTFVFLGNAHWPATWIGALLARARGKRVLFWTHGWIRRPEGFGEEIRKRFYRIANGLLLYGHHAKRLGIDAGFSPDRLHVIYNSLDYEAQAKARGEVPPGRARAIRQELFGHADLPTVICSARLVPGKRLDLLIEALGILRQDGVSAGLILVGDGPERAELERQSVLREVPTVFLGAIYDERRLAELMLASDVAVSPGPIGLTAIHALAYGTPVISHDDIESQMPESEAVLPGKTGEFFRKEDARDLARCIREWLVRSDRSVIRETARSVVERFWNPRFQRRVIERAIDGCPADDLFWLRESEGLPDAN